MWLGIIVYATYLTLLTGLGLGAVLAIPTGSEVDTIDRQGSAQTSSAARWPGRFTTAEVAVEHACALTESGRAVCWDLESNLKWDWEAPGDTYVSLSAGRHGFCAFAESGQMDCWFEGGANNSKLRQDAEEHAGGSRLSAIGVSSGYACALTARGDAICWGQQSESWPPPPEGPFVAITTPSIFGALGTIYRNVCGLRANGTVVCWGAHNEREYVEEGEGEAEYVAIKTRINGFCGLLKDRTWTCDWRYRIQPDRFAAINSSGMHDCAISETGRAHCEPDSSLNNWFAEDTMRMIPPDSSPDRFVSISVGEGSDGDRAYACAVTAAARTYCWRNEENKLERPDPPKDGYVDVSDGYGHTCALAADGRIDCWGWNNYGQAEAPEGRFASVSTGYASSCGITRSRDLICWGWLSTNPDGHPGGFPSRQYQSVSFGFNGLCAITSDDNLFCKNLIYANVLEQTPPGRFTAVSLGARELICALTDKGEAMCWNPSLPEMPPEIQPGQFSAISVDHSSLVCALTMSGEATCWALERNRHWQQPSGEFTSISSGSSGGCALSAAGEISCWGEMGTEPFTQIGATQSSSGIRFTEISVSVHRVCALSELRAVVCWGDTGYERAPQNPFVAH